MSFIHQKYGPLYLFLIFLGASMNSIAQSPIVPEILSSEDGLSQGFVTCIHQDKEGFLWIGTRNGLNRYDGYDFKVFSHDPLDSFSISDNIIASINEFGDFLLIGITNGGLNAFHKKTQRFYQLQLNDPAYSQLFQKNSITRLFFENNNTVWAVLRQSEEINVARMTLSINSNAIFNNSSEVLIVKNFTFFDLPPYSKLMMSPQQDKIWGMSKEQLFSIDTKTETVQYFNLPEGCNGKLFHTPSGEIWCNENKRTGKWDNSSWNWIDTDFPINWVNLDAGESDFTIRSEDEILVFDKALFDKRILKLVDAEYSLQFKKGAMTAYDHDRSGNLWIGTNGYGIYKYNPRLERFKTISKGVSIQGQILIDQDGNIGYYRDKNKNYFSSPDHHLIELKDQINGNTQIATDPEGNQWVVTGLMFKNYLYYRKKQGKEWNKILDFPKSQSITKALAIDRDGIIWMAFMQHFLRYDPKSGILDTFNFDQLIPGSHWITALLIATDGTFWIGTNEGLLHAVPHGKTFKFKLFEVEEGNPNAIQHNHITALVADTKDPTILWISTLGRGVSRMNTESLTFTHYQEGTGFPNNVVYGMLADDEGDIWMSSNKGIIQLHPSTGTIRNYTIADGLPTNEFNLWSYAKTSDGTMLFGCVQGLISFHPKDITNNPVTPQVHFTGLEINNRPVTYVDSTGILSQALEFTKTISLPYSQNNITLEMAALEYSAPSKNRFRYWLKGAESEWVHETTERKASYLNIAPGKYTFYAKACNGDGVWSEDAKALQITILPPWYRTNLAYLIYTLLFATAIYLSFQFFLHRQRLQHKLILEQKEAERLKELDDFKSTLYTNITHEFRTPLTVIQGMAGHIREQPEKWLHKGLDMIHRNTVNLLNLVNQILDLRKLESGNLSINWNHGNVVEYVRYIIESFHSYAESHGLQFHFLSTQDEILMDYDGEKLLRIISNLLSNAVKYTPTGGDIYLQLDQKEEVLLDEPTDILLIRVQDTGKGIPQEELPYIFDRYFQSERTEMNAGGTGIGLALVKELVSVLGGTIQATSNIGSGTTFFIRLPIHHMATESVEKLAQPITNVFDNLISPPEQPKTKNQKPANQNLPTLLIIEDNKDVAEYLTAAVEGNYHISHAPDGEQGIGLAIDQVPDIIISDVMMPKKDGFEVVKTLKNDERTSHIPIIMLTAKTDDASRIKGLERGADAYLPKPFNKEELLVRLRKLLELRQVLQLRYSSEQIAKRPGDPQWDEPKVTHFEDAFMEKLHNALIANLSDENFGTKELCLSLGMSRTQLHNKLKALTGKSTSIYIRSFRLHKAKDLLLTSEKSVSEVAFEVGFKHLQHFSSSFSEEFGSPPSQLKK